MRLDIGQVMSNEKVVLDFTLCEDLHDKQMVDGEKPFYQPVKVSGCVKNRHSGIELSGVVEAECIVPCARCLDDVSFTLSSPLKAFIGEKKEEEDLVIISGGRFIELDEAVDAALMYGYPLKVLCSEGCKGLCPVCGDNLNHGKCRCVLGEQN